MSPNVSQRIMRNGVLICEILTRGKNSWKDDALAPDTEYVYHAVNVNDMGHQSLRGEAVARTKAFSDDDDRNDRDSG